MRARQRGGYENYGPQQLASKNSTDLLPLLPPPPTTHTPLTEQTHTAAPPQARPEGPCVQARGVQHGSWAHRGHRPSPTSTRLGARKPKGTNEQPDQMRHGAAMGPGQSQGLWWGAPGGLGGLRGPAGAGGRAAALLTYISHKEMWKSGS